MNSKLPKIYIGGDHASYQEREMLQKHLYELGYDVYSEGSNNDQPTNYALYAIRVGNRVVENPGSIGIVMCGSGIGVNIAANKVNGVKSGLIYNDFLAKFAKNHHYNVIALGARFLPYKKIQKLVDLYLGINLEQVANTQKEAPNDVSVISSAWTVNSETNPAEAEASKINLPDKLADQDSETNINALTNNLEEKNPTD